MSNKKDNIKSLKSSKKIFNVTIILIDLITVILTYFIMPVVQSFPPLSEDFGFQEKVQTLTHVQQYSLVFILGITIHLISFKIIMRNITRYIEKYTNNKNFSDEEIFEIRKECQNIPYKVLLVQMSLFISIGIIFNLIMLVQFFTIIKFTLMIIAITSIVSLFTFIATQKFLNKILISTYSVSKVYKNNLGYRVDNTKSLILQTIPFIVVVLVILSLVGYAKAIEQKGLSSANYYKVYLNTSNIEQGNINKDYLMQQLSKIPLNDNEDTYFIINPYTKEIYNSNQENGISEFVLEYKEYFYDDFQEGMLYEDFGVDEQIYAKQLKDINGKSWLIGFKFSIIDETLLLYYFAIILLLVCVYFVILYIWAKNISKNTTRISNGLKEILNSNDIADNHIIPIMSNDELGDLAYYYNKIHKKLIDQQNIIKLQSIYEGIQETATDMAHFINNDASAVDGCISLLKEDDIRKDDYEYKRILDNMKLANDEILTLVKSTMNQFISNQNTNKNYFSLTKLLHNLANIEKINMAKIGGKLNLHIDKEIIIYGIENSLYLAIGNLIKNAKLTYIERKLKGDIDIWVTEDNDDNINISISDTAGGIKEDIKDKIFKERITTRGEKGTGLGLFFAQKNIKVDFKGEITFESIKDKGTTFYIKIPKNIDKF